MSNEGVTYSRGRTYYVAGVGILFDHGTTVPTDGVSDYAPGCIFQKTDGSADACLYINQGTLASCNFDALDVGTLLATNIPVVDTAGWFTATNAETVLAEIGELLLANAGTAAGAGPSPLIWDKAPVLETILDPTVGFYYFNDYLGAIDVTTADGYVITTVTSGAIVGVTDEDGGVLLVDSAGNNAADDGVNVQLPNCTFKPLAGRTIRFEARCKFNDNSALTGQFAIGLCKPGITAIIAAGAIEDTADKALWFHHGASTADKMSVITAKTSAEDIDADKATTVDDTYIKLGFVINGVTSIEWYADGVLVHTSSVLANIPNAVMCLSYVAKTEGAAKDGEMSVDWVRILQEGART